MENLIKLSRELVENYLSGNKQKLRKEHFFMFSISKFILLKEQILKKDFVNNVLYFDNIKNAKYISAILFFAEEIKKNGTYQINHTTIKLCKDIKNPQKLSEALWFFNKVRDSLAHGEYTIDLESDCLLINCDHSDQANNAYKLVCSIPIQLLNFISFYIEEINDNPKEKDLSLAYREYQKRNAVNYDIENKKIFSDSYIHKYIYYNNMHLEYDMKDIFEYRIKPKKTEYFEYRTEPKELKYFEYKIEPMKPEYFEHKIESMKPEYFEHRIEPKKTEYYEYKIEPMKSEYFEHRIEPKELKCFEHKIEPMKPEYFEHKIEPMKSEYFEHRIEPKELKCFEHRIEPKEQELYGLVKQLLKYKPSSKDEEKQIQQILKKFKRLIEERIKSEKQKNFDTKSSELIREISDILGIKLGTRNADSAIALYTYMNLVFSQNNEIDYSHICLRSLILDFDPNKSGQGTGKNYSNIINSINKLCIEFLKNMYGTINAYYNNPNENLRHTLMDIYAEFYTSIMNSIGKRNKLILTSIRNSIAHGNYYVNKNGSLNLYDGNGINDIKFSCVSFPQQLFNITKSIELGNIKDKYIMDDFFNELETIVDDTTLTKMTNIMNSFSNIVFGKDIDTKNSMEHMYHEAIANLITQHISKK